MADLSFHSVAVELVNRSLAGNEPLDPPMIDGRNVISIRSQLLEDIATGIGIFDEDEEDDIIIKRD